MTENKTEEEIEIKSIEDELAIDFKSFLTVDVSKQKEEIDTLISGILAKLEELCQVIENIRTESKDMLFTIAPVLHERCMETKPLFKQIDDLERFIAIVHQAVEDAENKVKIGEKELGSRNIKKILHNVPVPKFLLRKKEIQPYLKKEIQGKDYEKPIGFQTDQYFEPSFLLPTNDEQLASSTEEESND